MTSAEVLAIIADLASDNAESQSAAVSKLKAIPAGFLEDHPLPKKKVAPYLPRLANLLRSTCPDSIKEWCAQLIGESGVRSDENLAVLIPALGSDATGLLKSAIWAIGSYGKSAAPAIERLFDLTAHNDPQVRWRAVWALTEIVPSGIETANRFAAFFNDSERLVRGYAVIGFVKTAPPSPWSIEQLKRVVRDRDDMPRIHAKEAIKRWRKWNTGRFRFRIVSFFAEEHSSATASAWLSPVVLSGAKISAGGPCPGLAGPVFLVMSLLGTASFGEQMAGAASCTWGLARR